MASNWLDEGFRALASTGVRKLYTFSTGTYTPGMLRYVGLGYRRFGIQPTKSPPRVNWEFFAVVSGTCAPILPKEGPTALRSHSLWVFPPGSSHGWTGNEAHRAYITVFHFGVVPPQLEAAVREHGHLVLPLATTERTRLVALAKQMRPEFLQPTTFSHLMYQGALVELTLLALRKLPALQRPLPPSPAKRTVEAASAWFASNLGKIPSVEQVAEQVHVSSSTLRRMFLKARKETPARVFSRMRLEASMKLMSESSLKLDEIAAQCGYSCASDFCRAFRGVMKLTPAAWRRTVLSGPGYVRK